MLGKGAVTRLVNRMTTRHAMPGHGCHVALSTDDHRVKSVQIIEKLSSTEVLSSLVSSPLDGQDCVGEATENDHGAFISENLPHTAITGSCCKATSPVGRNGYGKHIERALDACYTCSRNRTDTTVVFVEKLQIPLVFVSRTDSNCYATEMDYDDSDDERKSLSESEFSDEGIHVLTPIDSIDSTSDTDNCKTESPTAFIFPDSIETLESNRNSVHHCSCTVMDLNHNERNINRTFPLPVPGTDDEPAIMEARTIGTSPLSLCTFHSHRLTTVRESVSELEDSPDCSDRSVVSDDPFMRRSGSVISGSSMDQLSWVSPGKNSSATVRSHSSDIPPNVSPLMARRSRRNATSDDASSTHRSPAQRRRRRAGTCLDIEEVKELTSRLNLQTRRPSVHAWKQKNFSGDQPKLITSEQQSNEQQCQGQSDVPWSRDFRDRMNSSLDWLKTELVSMREDDALLARRLLNIRKDMCKLKLQKSTFRHQLILEEAIEREEERDELQQVRDCDLTPDLFSPTLKQYGVTRMNLSSRRFSVF